ncbi:MAG: carboxypeptidase-like regulatory domain-containing protein [Nannocystaceae bacterium]
MSKRNLVIGTGLVALVVLALFYLLRGDAPPDPDEAASGSDAAAERRALVERKRTDREGRKLELSAPSKVTGIVTRASDGQGVSNAVVMLTRKAITQDASSEPGEPAAPLQVVTDDAGEFSVPGVPAGRYVISATARGFLPAQRNDIRIRPGQDDPRISLSLETGGYTLSGTVSDIGGGPIEEVLVSVNDRESSNLFGVRYAPPASLTDEDGHYEINLPNGAYVVTTYHPDYVATFRMAQIMDAPHVEDLQLTPGASIEGTVLARGSNEPVADAVVTFQDGRNGNAGGFRMNMSSDGRMVRTGPDGRFRLSGVHPGVAQVEARAARGASRESQAVPVGNGESVNGIELVLDQA